MAGRYGWARGRLRKADAGEPRRIVEDVSRRTAPRKTVREYDSAQG
jgi:hypothetical protein